MTIQDTVDTIHAEYEKNQDFPSIDSEDFQARLRLANSAITDWQNEAARGVRWAELYTEYTGTLVSGTATLPANYLIHAKYLYVSGRLYHFTTPAQARDAQLNNSGKNYFWVTGPKGAQTVHVTPTASGTYTLDYIRTATQYPTGVEGTPIDMGDASYIVDAVLVKLYMDDKDYAQGNFYLARANEKLQNMKIVNEATDADQDGLLGDYQDVGFGE